MSRVYGSKVKDSVKISCPSPQKDNEHSGKLSGLLEAWSSFGDIKSKLNDVEERAYGAVLVEERSKPKRHISKSALRHVNASSHRKDKKGGPPDKIPKVLKEKHRGEPAKGQEHKAAEEMNNSSITVEGTVLNSGSSTLNETFTVSPEHRPLEHRASTIGNGSKERVQDVMSSGGKVKHFSPSGGRGTIPSVEWSPANPSAIFGRAVNFTEHHSQPERRVQHSGDAQPNLSTKPKHVSSTQSKNRVEKTKHSHHKEPASSLHVQQEPLREFLLPPHEALSSLQARVDHQQQAVRKTAAVVNHLLQQPPIRPTAPPEQHVESYITGHVDSSSTQMSQDTSDSPPPKRIVRKVYRSPRKESLERSPERHARPLQYTASHRPIDVDPVLAYSRHSGQNPSLYPSSMFHKDPMDGNARQYAPASEGEMSLEDFSVRKRKVASVPPPQPVLGLVEPRMTVSSKPTSTTHRIHHQTQHPHHVSAHPHKPTVRKVSAPHKMRQRTHPTRTANKEESVTVKHKHDVVPNTITPSSWREGIELTKKVKAALKEAEQSTRQKRASSPRVSASEPLSTSMTSTGTQHHSSELSDVHSIPAAIEVHVPHGAVYKSDMEKLLEDLESSPGVKDKQDRLSPSPPEKRKLKKPSSSVAKKPRMTKEPSYDVPKQRHYDPSDIRVYMQKQKDERKRKQLEREQATRRNEEMKKQRLKELAAIQRNQLSSNLAKVYSRRQQLEHETEDLVSMPAVHLHVEDSEDTESDSHFREARNLDWEHFQQPRADSVKGQPYISPSHSPPKHRYWTHSPLQGQTRESYGVLKSGRSPEQATSPSHTSRGVTTSSLPPTVSPYLAPDTIEEEGPALSPASRKKKERLQALLLSAQALKTRISIEKSKLLDVADRGLPTAGVPPKGITPHHPVVERSTGVPHSSVPVARSQPTSLPGVGNMELHVRARDRLRAEAKAATTIQAAYRGHTVRKYLSAVGVFPKRKKNTHSSPTQGTTHERTGGITLGASRGNPLRSTPHGKTLGITEGIVWQTKPQSTQLLSYVKSESTPLSQNRDHFHGAPKNTSVSVPKHKQEDLELEDLPPWEKRGGDKHSIVNIYARKQSRKHQTRSADPRSSTPKEGKSSLPIPPAEPTSYDEELFDSVTPTEDASEEDTRQAEHKQEDVEVFPHLLSTEPHSNTDHYPSFVGSNNSHSVSVETNPVTVSTQQVSKSHPLYSESFESAVSSVQQLLEPDSLADEGSIGLQDGSPLTPSLSLETVPSVREAEVQTLQTETSSKTGERLSPRILEAQLSAEIQRWEAANEQMHRLSEIERAKAVRTEQEEALSLTQLLKSAHEKEMRLLSEKTQRDLDEMKRQLGSVHTEASFAAQRVNQLEKEAKEKADLHAQFMAKLEEQALQSQQRLAEARKEASEVVIEAAKKQLENAHNLATQTAVSAAKAAVKAVLHQQSSKEDNYSSASAFEDISTDTTRGSETTTKDSEDVSVEQVVTDGESSVKDEAETLASDSDNSTVTTLTGGEEVPGELQTDIPEDLDSTLHAEEEEDSGNKVVETDIVDETQTLSHSQIQTFSGVTTEEDDTVDKAMFRKVLPSEAHRRRQRKGRTPPPRLSLSSVSSDLMSSVSSVHDDLSPMDLTRWSPLPVNELDNSFDNFTLRIFDQFVKDQEIRAKHQRTLLKLKERALEEQTRAKLQVLEQWKKRLEKKGSDEKMPAIIKKKEGLLRRYKSEKAELKSLQEAERREREHRRLLRLQQKEIGKLHLSTQAYWKKARKLEEGDDNVSLSVSSLSPISFPGDSPLATPQALHSASTPMGKVVTPTGPTPTSVVDKVGHESSDITQHSSTSQLSDSVSSVIEVSVHQHTSPRTPQQSSTIYTIHSEPITESITKSINTTSALRQESEEGTSIQTESSVVTSTLENTVPPPMSEVEQAGQKSQSTIAHSPSPTLDVSISHRLKELEELSFSERKLAEREEKLMRQRVLAEKALQSQEKLLEREKKLKMTQAELSMLLDEADDIRNKRLEVMRSRPIENQSVGPAERLGEGDTVPLTTTADHDSSRTTHDASRPISQPVTAGITEDLSSITREESVMLEVPTEGSVEYGQDTFESVATVTGVLTSTPHQFPKLQLRSSRSHRDDHSPSSTDITTISTSTAESTEIELRINRLKDDVRRRREEVKRAQQEQKKKKRALLQEKEEQLKVKLQALEQKLQGAKQSFDSVVPSSVLLQSATTTASESEGEPDKMSQTTSIAQPSLQPTLAVVPTSVDANPLLSYTPFSEDVPATTGSRTTVPEGLSQSSQSEHSTLVAVPEIDNVVSRTLLADEQGGIPEVSRTRTASPTPKEDSSIAGNSAIVTELAQESSVSVLSANKTTDSSIEDVTSSLRSVHSVNTEFDEDKLTKQTARNGKEGDEMASVEDAKLSHRTIHEDTSSSETAVASASGVSPQSSRGGSPSVKSGRVSLSSVGSSPSRIPVPTRSSSTVSPRSSRRFQQVKVSTKSSQKEIKSEKDDTLKDISNYSDSFVDLTQSISAPTKQKTQSSLLVDTPHPPTSPVVTSAADVLPSDEEETSDEVPTDLQESASDDSVSIPTQRSDVLAGGAVLEEEQPPPSVVVLSAGVTSPEPQEHPMGQLEPPEATDVTSQLAQAFKVGQHVVVGNAVSGVVRFIGSVHFAPGTYVGVELDLPKGHHSGKMDDVQYFECPENCGVFAPPSKVTLLEEDQERTGLLGVTSSDEEEDQLMFGRESQTPDELRHISGDDREVHMRSSTSTKEESPTPSEISSEDDEFLVLIPQEEGEVPPHSPRAPREEEPTEKQRMESVAKEPQTVQPWVSKVNGVTEGLMNHIMSELVTDLSAAKKKKEVVQKVQEVNEKNKVLAENIANEMLSLYLQSEIHLLCNLRGAKLSAAVEEEQSSRFSPQKALDDTRPSHLLIVGHSDNTQGSVATPSPSTIHHRLSPEPPSPPLSPPGSPGSPPRYSARAVAGDRSPPSPSPDTQLAHTSSLSVAKPQRSLSLESLTSLLSEHHFTDGELSLLPRDQASIDLVTERAWNDFHNAVESGESVNDLQTPEFVLAIRPPIKQPSHLVTRDERVCRVAFLHLVYSLALEVIQETMLQTVGRVSPVGNPLSTSKKRMGGHASVAMVAPPTLETVQQKVFFKLIEGRLPIRLPKGRYHHGNRRPGGREVDFLESLLIKELRAEGRNWTEFEDDEYHIKLKTADNILASMISDTVKELQIIQQKKKSNS
jgi:hypothetical protein